MVSADGVSSTIFVAFISIHNNGKNLFSAFVYTVDILHAYTRYGLSNDRGQICVFYLTFKFKEIIVRVKEIFENSFSTFTDWVHLAYSDNRILGHVVRLLR